MERAPRRIRIRGRRNSRPELIAIAAWLAYAACAGARRLPRRRALGVWGGDHVTKTIASAGGHFEFDCAHGDVGTTLVLDARGQFNDPALARVSARCPGREFSKQPTAFRAEVFNLTNAVHLGQPDLLIDQPQAGRIMSTHAPARQVQLGLRFVF